MSVSERAAREARDLSGARVWLSPAETAGVTSADAPTDLRSNPPVIRKRSGPRLAVALDAVGLGVGLLVGATAVHFHWGVGVENGAGKLGLYSLVFMPLFLVSFGAYGLYDRQRRRLFATSFPDLVRLAHALVAGGAAALVASHLIHRHWASVPRLSLTGIVLLTLPCTVTVLTARVLGSSFLTIRGVIRSRVLILGSGVVATSVARRLSAYDDIQLLGLVDEQDPEPYALRSTPAIPRLGGISDLPGLCARLDVDRVIVAFSATAAPDLADTLRDLPSSVQISVVPRLFDLVTWRSQMDELHGLPVMDVAPPLSRPLHRGLKRALDLLVAILTLLLGLPLWIVIAIAIKLTSRGPVLFRQLRMGRRGEPFEIFKFRTMRTDAEREREALAGANEVDGPLFKIRDDPRITKIGKFLRATSLDEVPQLLNVIKGDMSLVGPRPFIVAEAGRIDGWAARRFDVRPGMTGLWQVSGRNDLPYEELRRLDYAYVASWSLWWDLRILWQTPACVVRKRGAY
jgi:exopolysaccharide biosynthesis polyprenyl glycosylphosphotransferase